MSAVVPRNLECAIGQNLVVLRADGKRISQGFLRWLVRGDEWWEQVRKYLNVGAVFDSLKCRDIPNFELLVPPLGDQERIAEVLDTLDHRINLLRQTNATLESIAQALFKSWFIDFDPVRAKAEGREPEGMDAATAALFPDAFEESALGLIPRGWTVSSILSHARLLSGGTPRTDRADYWNGEVAWASAKDVSQSDGTFLVETERTISELGLAESATQLVPAFSSVVVSRGATTGRMVLLGRDMAMNQTCYALASTCGAPFTLHCFLRKQIPALVRAGHGSVFNTITTSTFALANTVNAPTAILRAFESTVAPIFGGMLVNTNALRTLTQLRDALLPRLISGRLRLPDVHRHIDEALA